MNAHEPAYTQRHGPMEVPLRVLSLREEIAGLKQEAPWQRGNRAARTLVKEGGLRVVLLLMPAGDVLEEHQTEGPVTIHCLTGGATLHAQGRDVEMTEGAIAMLDGGVAHSIDAHTEVVLLVTLAL